MLTGISRLKAYKAMSQEEKGHLLDLLCAAEQSGGGFYADIKFTVPLTTQQIISLLGWDEITWEKFKNYMIQGNILKEHNGSVYCPFMAQVSTDGVGNEGLEIAREILGYWNSKKIIVHKETPALLKAIVKYVRKHEYSLEQVTDAIDNYAIVLHGSEYFWTKKWNLNDFLSRGVARFHHDQNPLEAFKNRSAVAQAAGKSIMTPRKECSEFPTEDEI